MIFKRKKRAEKAKLSKGQSEGQRPDTLIYAVGDIHGRFDLLVKLLEQIRIDAVATIGRPNDSANVKMVFLGDYIDRGHQSNQVLEALINMSFPGTEVICLKGNHEQAALEFLDRNADGSDWLKYGGRETLSSYGVDTGRKEGDQAWLNSVKEAFRAAFPERHLAFLKSLKLYWRYGDYLFVHAGIDPALSLENQTEKELLWIRGPFLNSVRKLPFIVVHGHTPEVKPVWDGRRIGVDTGAYISNILTAVKLYKGEVSFLAT